MSSIVTVVFKNTICLLVDKREAEMLKDHDLRDYTFRALIMPEIDHVLRSKLDGLSRKDLFTSISCFKEGMELLWKVFLSCTEGLERLELTGLDESVSRKLSKAKQSFRQARRVATGAFSNEALSTHDRILAMQYRVMATILETLDNPANALELCLFCLAELNHLPAVQDSFHVELNKGIRAFINKNKRREIIMRVCQLSRVVHDVALAVGEDPHLWKLPPVDTGEGKIDPLRDERVTEILRKLDMEYLHAKLWSFGQEREEALKLEKPEELPGIAPPPEILARGRLAVKAFNKALAEGKTSNKRVPIMLIGQDRSGKTSLKKSLLGQTFNPLEDSTVGIDADPSHFEVVQEVWKPGVKDKGADSEAAFSYEHHVARLTVANLREERSIRSETASESMQSETILQGNPFLTSGSSDSTTASPRARSTISAKSFGVSEDPNSSKSSRDPESGEEIPGVTEEKKDENQFGDGTPIVDEDIARLIEMLLKKDGEVKDKEEIYSVMWDFAGQLVYYTTHALFLTTRAIYILVNDLSQNPHGKAKPVTKQTMFGKFEDEFSLKTNLDYLDFWMSSVALLASQDQNAYMGSDSELLPEKLPPVLLVCTHADKPYGGGDPRTLAWEVFGSLRTKSYKSHLYDDVFVVDNTKAGPESECSDVARLRKEILDLAKELPQLKEDIPLKWLRYEKTLQSMKGNGRKWIHLENAKQIASTVCQIVDDEEFKTLLNFMHDQRIVIHFDDPPELNELVVLDPQWLIDVFKEVITVRPYNRKEKRFEHLWLNLEKTGILDEELLAHVWVPLFGNMEENKETFENLIAIMEKFSLLCPLSSSDASSRKQYLVPSMLKSHPPEGIRTLVASAQIPSLFLKFHSGHVPPGLFPRLVLQFFRFQSDKDEYMSLVRPQLYHNFARFFFSEDKNCSLVLLCHRSSIEVVVHKSSCSQRLAESQKSKTLTLCKSDNFETFDVTCARRLRRELGFILESMRKEFCWLKTMTYEVSFMCPVCCEGGSAKCCQEHSLKGCKEEKCLHFWPESELCNEIKIIHCMESADADENSIEVAMFAPWLPFKGSQLTANENDEGKLACVDEAKQLSLPGEVEQSLLSRSCDAKEVVLQLKENLQPDQTSLEHPDSETKQLIRCLARKAKDSNRPDVFEQLREITPAGTTGPLLSENLDVRGIPVPKARELTIALGGDDRWMELAEGLGLTPQEIRFLDRRTLNPFEAVLCFVARQRHVTVSELYDLLNKHGLPMLADIL